MQQHGKKDPAAVTVGLFGTCGASRWRVPFKQVYDKRGIAYFDPQVENWDPSLAAIEAEHLAEDEIILFPITNESYAAGSLAETGFSILQAIRLDDRRDFVILIDPTVDERLVTGNPEAAKDSVRARALVRKHLEKLRLSNVFVVDALPDMLAVSLRLYDAAVIKKGLVYLNPHRS